MLIKDLLKSILRSLKTFISEIFKVLRKNLNSEDWKDVIFLTFYLLFIFIIFSLFFYFISSCTLEISNFHLS